MCIVRISLKYISIYEKYVNTKLINNNIGLRVRYLSSALWRQVILYKHTNASKKPTATFFRTLHPCHFSTMNTETVLSSQTSINFYKSTRCYIPGSGVSYSYYTIYRFIAAHCSFYLFVSQHFLIFPK